MMTRLVPAIGLALMVAGCAPARPILYPNDLYREVGEPAAQEDVNHCIELAETHGFPTEKQPEEAAEGAARGGIIGAIVGGAIGWVFGNPGRGAAAGAAGGGTRGGIGGYESSGANDPTYRRFIETCLRDKGYQVIGWR